MRFGFTHLQSGGSDAVAELRAYLANVVIRDPVTSDQRFSSDVPWLDDHGKSLEPIQSATDAPEIANLPLSADEDLPSKETTKEPSHAIPNPLPSEPALPFLWSIIAAADLLHPLNPVLPRREVAAVNQTNAIMVVPP
jgi:hypothetical protein